MTRELTAFDLKAIAETEATMAIENMPMTSEDRQMLVDYATGAKSEAQILAEIRASVQRGEPVHG